MVPPNRRSCEQLWSMQRAGREIGCELLTGPAGACDCLVSDDDWLISSRRFPCRVDALAFAEEQRRALVNEGWTMNG